MLFAGHRNRVGLARVAQERTGRQPEPARGRQDARAPVAEAVTIGHRRNEGIGVHQVRFDDVGGAHVMDVQHQHHRRRLRALVDQVVPDAKDEGRMGELRTPMSCEAIGVGC